MKHVIGRSRSSRTAARRGLAALVLGAGTAPLLALFLASCSLPFPVISFKPAESERVAAAGAGMGAGAGAGVEPESTGSLPAAFGPAVPRDPSAPGPAPNRIPGALQTLAPELGEEDWRRARAALAVALDPQGNGRPVKWENPESGFKGTINPVKLPYVEADEICRGFLASITGPSLSRFVRGTGCRPSGGAWELRNVRPSKAAA